MKLTSKLLTLFIVASVMVSCGSETPKKEVANNESAKKEIKKEVEKVEPVAEASAGDKGVGPITSVTLGEIDPALVETGKEVYKANCTACHKIGKRVVGPALKGVTERRSPEWIMNMIMNPEEMVEKDPTAKALLAEYMAPMANQNITEDEARALLEFFRTKN